jgi:pimeloyl-ACP methyl ester carboxylesterase
MLALAAETEQHPFTGAGVDHREAEACFEPAPRPGDGYRRIYPDLPGLGRTPAPLSLRSADDVLQTLRLRRLGERTRRPTRSRPLGRLREVSALTT